MLSQALWCFETFKEKRRSLERLKKKFSFWRGGELDAVSRRLELLRLEGLGFFRVEVMKKLTVFGESEKLWDQRKNELGQTLRGGL
jgi:hypothetical protein